jgi:hypothetical protein
LKPQHRRARREQPSPRDPDLHRSARRTVPGDLDRLPPGSSDTIASAVSGTDHRWRPDHPHTKPVNHAASYPDAVEIGKPCPDANIEQDRKTVTVTIGYTEPHNVNHATTGADAHADRVGVRIRYTLSLFSRR